MVDCFVARSLDSRSTRSCSQARWVPVGPLGFLGAATHDDGDGPAVDTTAAAKVANHYTHGIAVVRVVRVRQQIQVEVRAVRALSGLRHTVA